MIHFSFRVVLMCGFFFLPIAAQSRNILVSGNGFDHSSNIFDTNLDQINHSFTFVDPEALMQTELSRYDAIWLDGFSFFNGLWAGTLMTYLNLGGTLFVQNPGFGSNSIDSYPFGDELAAVYTEPDFEEQVRIVEPYHPINVLLTDETLSDWRPVSAYGYFESNIGGFLGISDTGQDGRWVTLVREVGQGFLVYTHQAIIHAMDERGLGEYAAPLQFLRNVLRRAPYMAGLTPPLFLDESNLWLSSSGDLQITFPDPNSDGFDVSGDADFSYLFTIEKLGDPAYGPQEVTADVWPTVVTVTRDFVPEPPYFLGVSRRTNFVNQGNYFSEAKLINNPVEPTFPFELWSFRRWLLHLPKIVGGFEGVIELVNTNLSAASELFLVGFDAEGNRLVTTTVDLTAGETRTFELYSEAPDGIFGASELIDQISHLAIFEQIPKTRVSLQYVSVKSGFGVWVNEANLDRQLVNGREFVLSGVAPDTGYWDGVAVSNLSSRRAAAIDVTRLDANGEPAGQLSLGTLEPGQKLLAVLSDRFEPFATGVSYRITSREGTAEIQVLGLSGIKTGAFFAPAKIQRIR